LAPTRIFYSAEELEIIGLVERSLVPPGWNLSLS
jgi:predicted deacetylase